MALGDRYSKLLLDQPSFNDGTVGGGIANVIQQGLRGYMYGQEQEELAAQEALVDNVFQLLLRNNPATPATQMPIESGSPRYEAMSDAPIATGSPRFADDASPVATAPTQLAPSTRFAQVPGTPSDFDQALTMLSEGGLSDLAFNLLSQKREGEAAAAALAEQRAYDAEMTPSVSIMTGADFGQPDDLNSYAVTMQNGQVTEIEPLGAGGDTFNIGSGGLTLTPGQKELDISFAKDVHIPFVMEGGFASALKGMDQLQVAVDRLNAAVAGESDADLTGTMVSALSFFGDDVVAALNPEAMDTKQLVEEVVQRNLRLILGAQFTEKEGANLIARAYNPALSEAANADRLTRLLRSMQSGYAARYAATQYFQEYGTLDGYVAVLPNVPLNNAGLLATFDMALDGSVPSAGAPSAADVDAATELLVGGL